MNNKILGELGEKLVAEIILNEGYEILEMNYRCHLGEIDVIGRKDEEISFIEVKTRQSQTFGRPCEAVDPRKQWRIKKVAEMYMQKTDRLKLNVNFQVFEVLINRFEYCF